MIQYMAVMAGVFGLDTCSKHMVRKKIPIGSRKQIVKNYFSLRHIKNKGMAYNIGEQKPALVLYLTTILTGSCIFQFFYALCHKKRYGHILLPAAVMLGGAFGNLYDRWRNGSVTDFLYLHLKKAPIFNVADMALAIGALWTLVLTICKK